MSMKGTGRGYWSTNNKEKGSNIYNFNEVIPKVIGDVENPVFYKFKLYCQWDCELLINNKFRVWMTDRTFEMGEGDLPITSIQILESGGVYQAYGAFM